MQPCRLHKAIARWGVAALDGLDAFGQVAGVRLNYHAMEERPQALEDLLHWAERTPPLVIHDV
jgi:ABC-type uncharacterized transport system YnjBCD substrate-binding protein